LSGFPLDRLGCSPSRANITRAAKLGVLLGDAVDAIRRGGDVPACLPHFRPIMMRTIVGALPQLARLFITPVIYVYLENLWRMFREQAVAVPAAPRHEPNAPLVGN
jgi:hypothetical protein